MTESQPEITEPAHNVNTLVGYCATVKYAKASTVITGGRVFFADGDWHKVAEHTNVNYDPIEVVDTFGERLKISTYEAIAYAY